jgi:Right handed beta helix region
MIDPISSNKPRRRLLTVRIAVTFGGLALLAVAMSGCFSLDRPSVARCEANPASPGAGSTFYVDSVNGRDTNEGTSPRQAWRTLARVGRGGYRAGDAILLRGGQRFEGTICLGTANVWATPRAERLTIRSYGGGRATIAAPPRTDGIAAIDVGVHVADLNLVGRDDVCTLNESNGYRTGTAGIRLEARDLDGTLAPALKVTDADLQQFCEGIIVVSEDPGSRLAGVRISHVRAHDNSDAGIWTYDRARAEQLIADVRVTDTRAYRNGYRGGIMLFGVDRGTVAHSVAYDNAREGGGGVGIWAFDSNRIVFAHNESFGNGSPEITDDGDGFDFDRGVSHSVMFDNYSHDNGGVGLLVCSCNISESPFYRVHDITLRSNVSHNDGSSGQPSLYVYGGEPMTAVRILGNVVESARGDGPLVNLTGCHECSPADMADGGTGPYTSISVRGNTFAAGAGKPILVKDPGPRAVFEVRDNVWRSGG